jgi:hypothetical protein
MERGVTCSDVARRVWEAVEEMAATGDQAVENAVWVSLIEWFAHGDDGEGCACRRGATPRSQDQGDQGLLPAPRSGRNEVVRLSRRCWFDRGQSSTPGTSPTPTLCSPERSSGRNHETTATRGRQD